MYFLESGSVWSLCHDHEGYYITQLSGYMHCETTAIYRISKEEEIQYKSIGKEALNSVLNHFYDIKNLSDCKLSERYVPKNKYDAIRLCISNKSEVNT